MATFRLVRTRNRIWKIKYTTTKWKLNIKTQYLLLQFFLFIYLTYNSFPHKLFLNSSQVSLPFFITFLSPNSTPPNFFLCIYFSHIPFLIISLFLLLSPSNWKGQLSIFQPDCCNGDSLSLKTALVVSSHLQATGEIDVPC